MFSVFLPTTSCWFNIGTWRYLHHWNDLRPSTFPHRFLRWRWRGADQRWPLGNSNADLGCFEESFHSSRRGDARNPKKDFPKFPAKRDGENMFIKLQKGGGGRGVFFSFFWESRQQLFGQFCWAWTIHCFFMHFYAILQSKNWVPIRYMWKNKFYSFGGLVT